MASLETIREALAQTLADFGTIGQDAWIYDDMEDMSQVPAIIIDPDEADLEETFGASEDIWRLSIYVLVSRSRGTGIGQKELGPYLKRYGDKSIRQAIYDKSGLGLEETEATVYAISGYGGSFEIGKIDHVGAIIKVRVHTDGRQD